jgi:hypothetical protein
LFFSDNYPKFAAETQINNNNMEINNKTRESSSLSKSTLFMTLTAIFALTLMYSCNFSSTPSDTSASDADSVAAEPVAQSAEDLEAPKAFVENFYKEWRDAILEYDYVKQNVTDNMLQQLKDEYEYDCEGECLATWIFCYKGGGDVGELVSRKITAQDATHVLVESKYDNYEYDIVLTLVKEGDTYKIDNLKQEREAYTN